MYYLYLFIEWGKSEKQESSTFIQLYNNCAIHLIMYVTIEIDNNKKSFYLEMS